MSEQHLTGKTFTVVYEIKDPVAWRKSNPLKYAHDGAEAVSMARGDLVERHEKLVKALEAIEYWARSQTETRISLRDRITAALNKVLEEDAK